MYEREQTICRVTTNIQLPGQELCSARGIGVLTPSTSGLSPSCDLEEINIGFELQDGADWRQRSLTGQTGSDGLTYRANRREVLGSLLRDPL